MAILLTHQRLLEARLSLRFGILFGGDSCWRNLLEYVNAPVPFLIVSLSNHCGRKYLVV